MLLTVAQCNGERPSCANCAKKGAKCVYNTETATETRQAAVKRRLTELETKASKHQRLLRRIRAGTVDEASALVGQIRASNDPDDLYRNDEPDSVLLSPMLPGDDSGRILEQSLVTLLEALVSSTDQDSSMILARLRLGEPWEDIAESLSRIPAASMDSNDLRR